MQLASVIHATHTRLISKRQSVNDNLVNFGKCRKWLVLGTVGRLILGTCLKLKECTLLAHFTIEIRFIQTGNRITDRSDFSNRVFL